MAKVRYKIAVFKGDGIGPEVTQQAIRVLNAVSGYSDFAFDFHEGLIGGAAFDHSGHPLPDTSLALALESNAILLGAVGGPKWESLDSRLRPEQALLDLRKKLGLYANLRPVILFEDLLGASPLKRHIIRDVDIMIVRELTGGLYFGQPRGIKVVNGMRIGVNTLVYSEEEIDRIGRMAFSLASKRRRHICSVDKANVLESSKLWRDVMTRIGWDYPEVKLEHQYVDNCAMQLIRDPAQFDVIVTSNLFGDILSDEASMVTGSIGMLPSASLGEKTALYEPIHGSAPDIAGKNTANPIAAILSSAMMLRHSFHYPDEAAKIEAAVRACLKDGLRTPDIQQKGKQAVGTDTMGEAVVKKILE
ncbi:MAG: 3-isopropylmalate dehydrogenase [Syntrophales bacterium]|jgi:3-isopropylmalate dehydrogenase